MKRQLINILLIFILGVVIYRVVKKINLNSKYEVGQPIDSLNSVIVYYNGGVDNNSGRNTSAENYNIGIKYQCVEFVKRYYLQHLNHKMPDAYGHAKDFFDVGLADSSMNSRRNLIQFTNPSRSKPKPDDLIIFSGTTFNKYGHVAIAASVHEDNIEIIQQNPGPFGKSRDNISLNHSGNLWSLENSRILGWLRKE